MNISEILGRIVDEGNDTPACPDTDRLRPCEPVDPPSDVSCTEVRFDADGWVRQIDRDRLVAVAARA